MNARADRFPLFDGLRALAALSVLAYHVTFGGFNGLPNPLREYAAHLDSGVTIFFVISGFLLYRPFVKARLLGDPIPRVRAYAWRRFLRIVPAYWVALTVVALWLSLPRLFSAAGIPTYYGFLQVYSSHPHTSLGGIGQAWTLCIEVTFYAFLAVWALLMRARKARTPDRALATELAGLVVLFVAGTAYLIWAINRAPATSAPHFKTLPAYVDQFAFGMALAVVSAWHQTQSRAPRAALALKRVPSLGWLVAALALSGASLQRIADPQTSFLVRHELYTLIGVGVVVPAVLFPAGRGLAGGVLNRRFMLYLGLWSYAIYLYHPAVISKLTGSVRDVVPSGAGWQTAGLAVATLVVTVAIAAASYYVVERPALSLKTRFPLATAAARGGAIVEPAPASPPTGSTAG